MALQQGNDYEGFSSRSLTVPTRDFSLIKSGAFIKSAPLFDQDVEVLQSSLSSSSEGIKESIPFCRRIWYHLASFLMSL